MNHSPDPMACMRDGHIGRPGTGLMSFMCVFSGEVCLVVLRDKPGTLSLD